MTCVNVNLDMCCLKTNPPAVVVCVMAGIENDNGLLLKDTARRDLHLFLLHLSVPRTGLLLTDVTGC